MYYSINYDSKVWFGFTLVRGYFTRNYAFIHCYCFNDLSPKPESTNVSDQLPLECLRFYILLVNRYPAWNHFSSQCDGDVSISFFPVATHFSQCCVLHLLSSFLCIGDKAQFFSLLAYFSPFCW